MIHLSAAERRALKARAHRLRASVIIGEAGLTPAVLNEIDASLKSHELIKVRVLGEDRMRRRNWIDEICSALGAAPVQVIGKLLVVYRPPPPQSTASDKQDKAPTRRRGEKRRTKRSHQMAQRRGRALARR